MKPWKRFQDDTVVDLKWRKAVTKYFELPNGVKGEFLTIDCKADNAAVVALTREGEVIVAKQFRPGPERVMYELPGGGCEVGEAPEATAWREFQEETGYTSDEPLVYLGKVVRDAYHTDDTYYYLLRGCYPAEVRVLNSDEREDIELELHTMEEMIEYAKQGLISDPAAIGFARDKLMELESN